MDKEIKELKVSLQKIETERDLYKSAQENLKKLVDEKEKLICDLHGKVKLSK